jgi:hypothetical protein
VRDGGDFVPAGVDIDFSVLGPPVRQRAWRLYIEGLQVSQQVADQQIKAEAFFPEAGGPGLRINDPVRMTLAGLRLVEVDETNQIKPARDFKFSHPSPVVKLSTVEVTNLRVSEDGSALLGDLTLAGTILCSVCDYTPKDLGTIDDVQVFVNDRETALANLPVSSSKADEAPSLLKPFALTATFSGTLAGIELQAGGNLIRVDATDKVYGITGYSEASVEVESQDPGPVVVDYRVMLDFGGAQSLAELTPETPVLLSLVDKVSARTFTGEVFRTSQDSALAFTSADASVTILDPSALDGALSHAARGRITVNVSVPSIAAFAFSYGLTETDATSSVFAREMVQAELGFAGALNTSAPDVVEASVGDGWAVTVTASLTETGNDTQIFVSGDGTLVVRIAVSQPLGGFGSGILDVQVTSTALGITDRLLTVLEAQPGTFATDDTSVIHSYDRPTFSGWQFAAKDGVFVGASSGGEFNPYMLQIRGPESFLAQLAAIETDDGPRAVRKAFDGNYYVYMKNSPPGIYLMVPLPVAVAAGPPVDLGVSADFLKGYVKGFLLGGWGLVEGLYELGKLAVKEGLRLSPMGFVYVMAFGDRYQSEVEFARNVKDLAVKLAELQMRIRQDEAAVITALLVGDYSAIATLSEPYRIGMQLAVELLKALGEVYADSPPEQQGYILGRAVFEVFALVAVFAKAGQLGKITKLEFLTQLKNVAFFKDARVAQAFTRIGELMKSLAVTNMCFVAGTKVHTAAGLKNIEDVRIGDRVLSRDARTKAQDYKLVVRTIVTHPTRLYRLRYRAREHLQHGPRASVEDAGDAEGDEEPSELVATGEHPFYVVDRAAFVPMEQLKKGDQLSLAGGELAEVLALEFEKPAPSGTYTTYNLEVSDFSTYFVGREGVWVHNAASQACQRLHSIYRMMRARGLGVEAVFEELRLKLPALNANTMGLAVEEAFAEIVPGVAKVWTRGKPKFVNGGANAWDHFMRHVIEPLQAGLPKDVPAWVDTFVKYVRAARGLVDAPPPGTQSFIRLSRKGINSPALREQVFLNPSTGEFAVKVLEQAEAGAVKTYYIPKEKGGPLPYFLNELVTAQTEGRLLSGIVTH